MDVGVGWEALGRTHDHIPHTPVWVPVRTTEMNYYLGISLFNNVRHSSPTRLSSLVRCSVFIYLLTHASAVEPATPRVAYPTPH